MKNNNIANAFIFLILLLTTVVLMALAANGYLQKEAAIEANAITEGFEKHADLAFPFITGAKLISRQILPNSWVIIPDNQFQGGKKKPLF